MMKMMSMELSHSNQRPMASGVFIIFIIFMRRWE